MFCQIPLDIRLRCKFLLSKELGSVHSSLCTDRSGHRHDQGRPVSVGTVSQGGFCDDHDGRYLFLMQLLTVGKMLSFDAF